MIKASSSQSLGSHVLSHEEDVSLFVPRASESTMRDDGVIERDRRILKKKGREKSIFGSSIVKNGTQTVVFPRQTDRCALARHRTGT